MRIETELTCEHVAERGHFDHVRFGEAVRDGLQVVLSIPDGAIYKVGKRFRVTIEEVAP